MKKKYLSRYTVYALSLIMCVNPVFASKRAELTVNHSLVKKEELLPSLEIRDDALNEEEGGARNIARIGQDIGQKGDMHSAIKDLSEGFISDYVSDLLNQYGNARIGLHSEKKQVHYDVDYLYPAYVDSNNQQVLFGQFDAHQYSRHIMNVGIGYRKAFDETGIVGTNIFSDYDLNGHNVRIGVGGELLYGGYSLALNGYRGITDWHQSEITGMEDYDEKPASGYDVRVNALLPYHLDLTGVYEKYYGDKVSLTGGRENIYNSPQNIKVIARYTPVPMFSFSMEQGTKTGFGVAAQLNYHFGVPLKDQLRSDVLYPVYNTTESKLFDFVNRNYDIPIKYKKQTVLTVNMPSKITSEYGEVVTITPNIYSKYGVKNICWHTRTVVDEGGTSSTVGRGIHIKLPPQKKAGSEEFVVTVEVTDNKLHKERASTIIIATPSNKVLTSQVVKNSAQADGVQKDIIKFIAFNKETKGVLSNKKIHLTGSGVTIVTPDIVTNSLGVACAGILSTHSGSHSIKAELENGFSINTNIQFVPDVNSVTVSSNILKNNALANNQSENEISVFVSDKYGNPVPDLELNIVTTNSARVLSEKIQTDDTGHALIKIKSTVSGNAVIQIFINDVMHNKTNVNFLADQGTARISSGLMVDNYAQEGTGYDLLKVQVSDAFSNPVSAFPVSFSGDFALVFASSIVKTDDKGFASVKIRGKKPGCFDGIGSVPGSEPTHVSVCFSINPERARISMFKMDTDGQVADGRHSNKFTIKITDAITGVPLEHVHAWVNSADNRLHITHGAVTNSDGEIKGEATSLVSGEFQLAARLHGDTQKIDSQVMTNFVADISTANVSLDIIKDGVSADGISKAAIKARVTDANDNPLTQKDLLISGDDIIIDKNNIKTNNNGFAMIYVSTKSAGRKRITIKLKENTHSSSVADLTFSGDAGTARIKSVVTPSVPVIADGNDMGAISVNIEDANGNTVSGVDVLVERADPALVFKSTDVRSDLLGNAMFRVSSIHSGKFSFSLKVAGQTTKSCSYVISFVGDKKTLSLGHMVVLKDNALADGSDMDTLRVYLVDKNSNPVSDARVRFTNLPTGWTATTRSGVTNQDGWVDLSVTSTQVIGEGKTSVGYSSDVTDEHVVTSPNLRFMYDVSSVTIQTKIVKDNASTNGVEADVVEVTVSDKYSIPVSTERLNVSAKDDVLFPKTLLTDSHGYARLNISSQRAGYKTLNVSLGDKSASVVVYFKADVSTGSVSQIHVIHDNAYIPNKDQIQAVVTDAHGDPVEGAIVKFSYLGKKGLTGLTGDYITDKEGKTSVLYVGVSDPIDGAYTVKANIKDHLDRGMQTQNIKFKFPGRFGLLSFKRKNDDVIMNADIVRADNGRPLQDFFRYSVVGDLNRKAGHEYSSAASVTGGKVEVQFSGICDASHMMTPQDELWFTLKDKHGGFLINSKASKLSEVCREK